MSPSASTDTRTTVIHQQTTTIPELDGGIRGRVPSFTVAEGEYAVKVTVRLGAATRSAQCEHPH